MARLLPGALSPDAASNALVSSVYRDGWGNGFLLGPPEYLMEVVGTLFNSRS